MKINQVLGTGATLITPLRATVLLFVVLLVAWGGITVAGEDRRVIGVSAERFQFTPSRIEVAVGEEVVLELRSEDTYHGFRLPSTGLNVTIPSRGQGNVRILFNAQEPGSYVFECSRPCGAGHTMMRGVIVAKE